MLADISEDKGWMVFELEGKAGDIEEGITWAISRGIQVEPIS